MKRLSLLLFAGALALTQPAFAQDEAALQRARQAAAARRAAHGNVATGQQRFQATQHVNQNPAMQRRYYDALNTARVNTANAARNAAIVRAQNWQANRNWQNRINNGGVVTANQDLRRTDSSTSVNDWQNRNAVWQADRSRWNGSVNWDRQRRNRSWWRSHYTRFALFGGGYYYWNGGYWYPAYGYDPYFSTYSYDAPLYAYNDQDPGQVIADVQAALQRRGYDPGGVDGTYGPMTRRALLDFQHDNGLPITGQIDQPTLDSLGFR